MARPWLGQILSWFAMGIARATQNNSSKRWLAVPPSTTVSSTTAEDK
jgi:hypothetical protein